MRIAVAGATGRIGQRTMAALRLAGHTPVAISRSDGVDVLTGAGLDAALAGTEAVIDATNTAATDPEETVVFFRTATTNLLAAEQRAGVGHHVLLSIVGVERVPDNAHYRGKIAQEALVTQGAVPATIVRATQFFDYPLMVASWNRNGDTVTLPPLLMRPISPDDVAGVLAEVAVAGPQRSFEVAGPDNQDMIDMARRSLASRGETLRIVPTWDGPMGTAAAGNALLPGTGARITPTSFDDWLSSGGPARAG
jgi:uncharacterized protein YbjT (DUF2867 family)